MIFVLQSEDGKYVARTATQDGESSYTSDLKEAKIFFTATQADEFRAAHEKIVGVTTGRKSNDAT